MLIVSDGSRRLQKNITKEIKVITNQQIVKGQKQHGFPMRKWKISLMGIDADGEEEPLPYVDYVEYMLHQTFEQPLRKVTEYPFALQEKGWGEFDMKIMLYFADKSNAPFVLDHDLHFQMAHYEVTHTLTFKPDLKPSFLKLLNQPVETIPDRGSHFEAKTNKRRRDDMLKTKSKRLKDDTSSDDDSSVSTSPEGWNNEIDIHALAEKFQLLQADDLLDLVKLVKANQTSDMYVKEDGEASLSHWSNTRRQHRYETAPSSYRGVSYIIRIALRLLFVLAVSTGLLYTTLAAIVASHRSSMVLPFTRESAEYKALNNDLSKYDVKDLFNCFDSNLWIAPHVDLQL
ncbi:hypothetical protein EDD11_002801 [Mortierella claussenii]|nr:hypothetical protein EDD11_002801 [Mortierella claussenii]